MIPEFGHFALIIALALAIVQATVPLFGAYKNNVTLIAMAKPLAYGQTIFIIISFIALGYCFVSNDFSVLYVAENSNTHLPLLYRFAAIWGAHEGSLLLWVTVLALWSSAVATFSKSLPQDFLARVLAVLAMISIGFLLFMLTTSDPFQRLFTTIPQNGEDLNPLLQDPGLASHPPMLYMGYVGFSVAFAFAIAALITGRLDSAWARWTRPWTLAAWCFLTLGITLGSWWAYRVLGWGGWWFWDPVENASFLPWLTGTALIHSLAVTEKRSAFKSWTVLLAIMAFSLSLIGTFLVRSGILTSVHAFAVDPARGAYILKFLALVIGGSLILYAWRAPMIKSQGNFKLLSRETLLLVNNVLLITAMVTILLGTLYPLLIQSLGYGKISVGAPYFNTVFIPLLVPLFLAMGVGPQCQWQQMSIKLLGHKIIWALFASIIVALLLPLILANHESFYAILGLALALWVISSTIQSLLGRIKSIGKGVASLKLIPANQYGMLLAHLGIAVCIIGVSLTSNYSIERNVRMAPGDSVTVAGYNFKFQRAYDVNGPNYRGVRTDFAISRHGKQVATVHPEKRLYIPDNSATSKAAIKKNLWLDLYVVLGEPINNGAWSVRVYYKPFVRWIWVGGLIMVLGGLLALSDRRYRVRR